MKKGIRILAALLSLLMLLSLAACGASAEDVVKNLLGEKKVDAIRLKDFDRPEDYYRAVELRRAEEHIGVLTGTTNLDTITAQKAFYQNDLTVKLNQDALDRETLSTLTQMAGMDLSWIRNAGVSIASGRQDNLGVLDAKVSINDTNIVTANVVLDNASSTAYAKVPELSDQFFRVNLGDMLNSSLGVRVDTSVIGQILSGSWVDPMQVTALVEKYYGIALNNLSNIQVREDNLTISGVSCKCNVATVTVGSEDMFRVATACLNEAQNDTQLEEIVYDFLTLVGSYNGSSLAFHSDYQSMLRSATTNLERVSFINIPISARMTVYIDSNGEILGRRVEIQRSSSEQIILSYLTARSGSKLGVEAEFGTRSTNNESFIRANGSGTYTSAGKLKGDFQLSFYQNNSYNGVIDMSLGVLSADGTISRDGFIGELVLTPSEEMKVQLLEEIYGAPEAINDLVRSLSLAIVNKSSGEKTNLTVSLRTNGKDLLSVSFVQTPTKALKFSIPSDAVDFRSWASGFGITTLNTILNNLTSAGVPNSVVNAPFNGLVSSLLR